MIDLEDIRQYSLSMPHATEDLPFGPDTLAFRIGGKIFGLMSLALSDHQRINLKCDPAKVEDLRADYNYIIPGYHMNKTHWITILLNEDAEIKVVRRLTEDSYNIVKESLSKSVKETLK
jgi:predicted DNA-binding protein (MmcQ/YjbR family)